MDPDDKLRRIMQQSGLFDSEEDEDDKEFSALSEEEWTPDILKKKYMKRSIGASNRSFQVPKQIKGFEDISNFKNNQPSSPVDNLETDSSHLPTFFGITAPNKEQPCSSVINLDTNVPHLPSSSGISQKKIKLNEECGLLETDDDANVENDSSRESPSILNPQTGFCGTVDMEIKLSKCTQNFEDISNINNKQPSSPIDTLVTDSSYIPSSSGITSPKNVQPSSPLNTLKTDYAHLPSFSGIPPKKMKLNEKSGLFESDDANEGHNDGQELPLILNPQTGLFETAELEIDSSAPMCKKRISRRDQWERNKKIKRNLKNHKLEELPACRCKCKDKLSKKQVKKAFEKFINLQSHTEQNIYLQGCLQEVNPKRFRPRGKENKRNTPRTRRVFEYTINLPNKSISVCQKVFLAIHGIKRDRLVCKVQHQERDVCDGRGRKSNQKFDAETVTKVHAFIENLPARQSHYCRTSSKHRRYLDSHLCIAELHRKFSLDNPECIVSYEKFQSIFNQDFNITFGQPRKDVCSTCEKFQTDISSAELSKDINKVQQLKSAQDLHLRKAEAFLNSISKEEKEKQSNKLSLCFDFQKNMPLPVTNITDEYYLRQLWMHNFGVHNLSQNRASMFLFTENYAHKGPNEVITALEYYITKQKLPSQHQLHLYCDNCFSQNKNRYMFTFLDQLCAKGIFEKITVSYPIPGHSMMPIDRDFALIERKKKKFEKIYSPEYYVQLIKDSKNTNKFDIVFLEKSLMKENGSEDVLKVKDYKKLYNERIKVNLPGISKCRRVIFKKMGKPEFSMSMKGQDFKQFSLYKVGFSRLISEAPDDCYDAPCAIKAAKVKDIKRLLQHVPESERYFYEDLFNDNCDATGEEIDSTEEVE